MNGLQLHGKLEDGTNFDFDNDHKNTPSIHIDYNYHKKRTVKPGQALDIETLDDTWFIYLQTKMMLSLKFIYLSKNYMIIHLKRGNCKKLHAFHSNNLLNLYIILIFYLIFYYIFCIIKKH